MTAHRLTLTQRCDLFDLWILFLVAVPLHAEHEWLKWNTCSPLCNLARCSTVSFAQTRGHLYVAGRSPKEM